MTFCLPQQDDRDQNGAVFRASSGGRQDIARFVASSDRPNGSGRTRSRISYSLPPERPQEASAEPPRTYDEFRAAVSRRNRPLKGQLATAAAFLLTHPYDVAFDTVRDLASRAGVSPSTFVRLAQDLGLPSFSRLRRLFEQHLLSNASASAASTGSNRLSHVVQMAEQTLQRIDLVVSGAAITEAVQVLAPADTIFLVGLRAHPGRS